MTDARGIVVQSPAPQDPASRPRRKRGDCGISLLEQRPTPVSEQTAAVGGKRAERRRQSEAMWLNHMRIAGSGVSGRVPLQRVEAPEVPCMIR